MKLKLLLFACSFGSIALVFAQSENESARNFGVNKLLVSGHGTFLYASDSTFSSFGDVSFSIKFLAKLSDRLFIEPELEVETGEGEASFGLEQMNLVYMAGSNLMIHAGRFLPKFGAYRGRLGEDFVNRFPNNPVGYGDGGIGPMVETGVGILGGLPLGTAKMNYDIWIADGPQLLTDAESAGQFEYEAFNDNNKNKAIGGRIGLLPFSNSSLEIGVSFFNASKTGASLDPDYEKVGVTMSAVDLNYFKNVSALKSTIRIISEWKQQKVDKADYISIDPADTNLITFDNTSKALYGCFLIRPSSSENNFVRNLEVGYRYSQYETPEKAAWGGAKRTQSAFTIDYWLKWNSVLKLTLVQQKDTPDLFLAQLVYGF